MRKILFFALILAGFTIVTPAKAQSSEEDAGSSSSVVVGEDDAGTTAEEDAGTTVEEQPSAVQDLVPASDGGLQDSPATAKTPRRAILTGNCPQADYSTPIWWGKRGEVPDGTCKCPAGTRPGVRGTSDECWKSDKNEDENCQRELDGKRALAVTDDAVVEVYWCSAAGTPTIGRRSNSAVIYCIPEENFALDSPDHEKDQDRRIGEVEDKMNNLESVPQSNNGQNGLPRQTDNESESVEKMENYFTFSPGLVSMILGSQVLLGGSVRLGWEGINTLTDGTKTETDGWRIWVLLSGGVGLTNNESYNDFISVQSGAGYRVLRFLWIDLYGKFLSASWDPAAHWERRGAGFGGSFDFLPLAIFSDSSRFVSNLLRIWVDVGTEGVWTRGQVFDQATWLIDVSIGVGLVFTF